MFPAIKPSRRASGALFLCMTVLTSLGYAEPDDEVVEHYLREHRMDTLLEVQLEERIAKAQSEAERVDLGEELSSLYLRQLRELEAGNPYRAIVLNRGEALVARLGQAPLYELRLELLIDSYASHEQDIELHRLGLLDSGRRDAARQAMSESIRGFKRIFTMVETELSKLDRRSAQPMSSQMIQRVNEQVDLLRRHRSLASYYSGWGEYSLAVLDNRHVGDDAYFAFGHLLGSEGGIPQSKDLPRAALQYEHVARSAIGVAMCYAQSESPSLAEAWIDALLDSQDITPVVRSAAMSRKLQILASSKEWHEANKYAREMMREMASDTGRDARISVSDARYITMRALDERASRSLPDASKDEAGKLARLGLEQLVELGEIGHIVDLYQRYGSLPLLSEGFVSNYAVALGALNAADAGSAVPGYLDIAQIFNQALKASDSKDYPKLREDCRLKFAYALIRGDRPQDAINPCKRVIDTTLSDEAKQEARWLMINAYDRMNVIANQASSQELDQAVRAYVEAYPSTPRTARLIMRHAMRGTIDDTVAIDTLSAIDDADPIAVPARRTLVRLMYQRLRAMGFTDQRSLVDVRRRISWLTNQPIDPEDADGSRARLDTLRLGIDLALRSIPADTNDAEMLIEQARTMIDSAPDRAAIESELAYQEIQIALIQKRQDQAVSMIEPLRLLDEQRADEAQVLVLNALIDLWSIRKDARLAGFIEQLGSPVIARVTPKVPAQISLQTSALIEVVSHAAKLLADTTGEQQHLELAGRLSRQVLQRGQPSEAGLRRTAQIADELEDDPTGLEAWLRLLAAYPTEDDLWFEARYESLAIMSRIDPQRANETFQQFRVLNPQLGPSPWGEWIAALFPQSPDENP